MNKVHATINQIAHLNKHYPRHEVIKIACEQLSNAPINKQIKFAYYGYVNGVWELDGVVVKPYKRREKEFNPHEFEREWSAKNGLSEDPVGDFIKELRNK